MLTIVMAAWLDPQVIEIPVVDGGGRDSLTLYSFDNTLDGRSAKFRPSPTSPWISPTF